jgi:hypothetical protein
MGQILEQDFETRSRRVTRVQVVALDMRAEEVEVNRRFR